MERSRNVFRRTVYTLHVLQQAMPRFRDRRGQIEVDRSRLAAAACERHGTMRLEVEADLLMTGQSRVLVVQADAAAESGDAM
jgi:hypothetical protein